MRRREGHLTPQERKFVEALASTGNRQFALKAAGYKGENNAAQVANRPQVQAAIIATQVARLTDEALPLAVQTVVSVMKNEKAPAAARIQAAREVFNRVLPSEKGPEGKEPHEMTPEELAAAIDRLESAAAAKARPAAPAKPSLSGPRDVEDAETVEPETGGIFD